MEDYLAYLAFSNYDRGLLTYLIPVGYLTFLLYFYGSERWKSFSDFDKIAFTLLTCYSLLNFLIVPLTISFKLFYNFFYFSGEENLLHPIQDASVYKQSLLVFIFILYMMRYSHKDSLYENKQVNKFIFYFILFCIVTLFLSGAYFWVLSFLIGSFSYYEYLKYGLSYSMIRLFGLLAIYLLINDYLRTLSLNLVENLICEIEATFAYFKSIFNKKECEILPRNIPILSSVFVLSLLIGFVVFNPTINVNSSQIREIVIDNLPSGSYSQLTAEAILYTYYTVEPPIALSWVKVSSDSDVEKAYSVTDGVRKEIYKFDNYFIINESSKTNVTAVLREQINVTDELIFEKKCPEYKNETESFEIFLESNLSGDIDINSIEFYLDSNYVPTRIEKKFLSRGPGYTETYSVDNPKFFDQFVIRGNSLFLVGPILGKNDSFSISVALKRRDTD